MLKKIQTRLLESAEQHLTPLPYPATQSLLHSSLKPHLYHIPIKSQTHTFIRKYINTKLVIEQHWHKLYSFDFFL